VEVRAVLHLILRHREAAVVKTSKKKEIKLIEAEIRRALKGEAEAEAEAIATKEQAGIKTINLDLVKA
jgi:hypothetical protein